MSFVFWVLVSAVSLLAMGTFIEFRAAGQGARRFNLGTIEHSISRLASQTVPQRPPRRHNHLYLFLTTLAIYITIAVYLVLYRGSIVGDTEARVAQAWYVVASRDPHLGAIGFIWNPLPSLAAIPFVILRDVWPVLTHRSFAGSIVSALAMAGAVVQFKAAVEVIGARKRVQLVLTACLALNPMTLYYGANGMSEALYLLFLIGAARYLLAWMVSGELRPLVLTALNLALGYLTRYETLAAAALAVAVVVFVGTGARDRRVPRRQRIKAASADALIVVVPTLVAFVGWVTVSWVIAGQPLAQFTSRYGNASIIRAAGGLGNANGTGWPRAVLAFVQLSSYAPFTLVLFVIVIIVGAQRRDRRFFGVAPLAGALAFSFLAYVDGQIFGFLRYYIPTLPLFLLAAALLLSPLPGMEPSTPRWMSQKWAEIALALLVGLPGMATTALAMGSTEIGPAEQSALVWLFHPARTQAERQAEGFLGSAQFIAGKLDALGLPAGSVALDTFDCGSWIVLNSSNPHQFVITSDRDFQGVVADPVAFGVDYLLVPNGDQGINAITLAHPGVFSGGTTGDVTTRVVGQYATVGCPTYRLLRVTKIGS